MKPDQAIEALVEVDDLAVAFGVEEAPVHAVRGVSLRIGQGETLGIVGESGSGKSVLARAIMGLTATDPACTTSGSVRFDGAEIAGRSSRELRRMWGTGIAMVFQDPQASLNPVRTVGAHFRVPLQMHCGLGRRAARRRSLELLELVGIPDPERRLGQYPHELSGGMRQRIMIALAVSCSPRLLIADEPTTALDVTVQRQVLDLIDELAQDRGMAVVLISHDLAVVSGRADRIAVMYNGRIVETASASALFAHPEHPYTRALMESIPDPAERGSPLRAITGSPPDPRAEETGCAFAPRCGEATDICRNEVPVLLDSALGPRRAVSCHLRHSPQRNAPAWSIERRTSQPSVIPERDGETSPVLRVHDLTVTFPVAGGRTVHAVSGLSFELGLGETLGIVGESGCGKSTAARAIMRLIEPAGGSVQLGGTELVGLGGNELTAARAPMQMIFQDPQSSLNPRRRVRDLVAEGLRIRNSRLADDEVEQRVRRALRMVELDYEVVADRRPHEFSGGQRQRICVARALMLEPTVLVCDEIVSALDVSVQAQLLNMLARRKAELGLSLLFIGHDLAVVEHVSDRVLVMYLGKQCELGPAELVLRRPAHPYTRLLVDSVPQMEASRAARGPTDASEIPSPLDPPSGCRFRTRCPKAQQICADEEPTLREVGAGHVVACHFPLVVDLTADTEPSSPELRLPKEQPRT